MVTQNKNGFTIVELLIVIVVIGILATIAIVSYNGISKKAILSSLQSDLRNGSKILQNDKTLSSGESYPDTLASANGGKGIKGANGATYQYHVNNALNTKKYCLTGTISDISYFVDQTGVISSGACAGHGAGGVVPITNYDTGAGNRPGTSIYVIGSGGSSTAGITTTPFGTGDQNYSRAVYSSGNSSKNLYICRAGADGIGNPVTGNQTYTFSAYINPSWVTQIQLIVRVYDSSQTFTPSPLSSATTSVPNQWQRLTYTYTLPSSAVTAATCVVYSGGSSTSPPAGGTVDVSGFMITQGSTVYNYADGASPGWAWSDDNARQGPATSSGPAL